MKSIILSADSEYMVYAVPDKVADHLHEYCLQFCNDWLRHSPDAAQYRRGNVVCYREADFIAWLNTWMFPDEPSAFVENLGWIDEPSELPSRYRGCPQFHF